MTKIDVVRTLLHCDELLVVLRRDKEEAYEGLSYRKTDLIKLEHDLEVAKASETLKGLEGKNEVARNADLVDKTQGLREEIMDAKVQVADAQYRLEVARSKCIQAERRQDLFKLLFDKGIVEVNHDLVTAAEGVQGGRQEAGDV